MLNQDTARMFVLSSIAQYVPANSHGALQVLPIPTCQGPSTPDLCQITLPDWASDLGAGDVPSLLVPRYCLDTAPAVARDRADWQRCDWWQACFSHLTCEFERAYEAEHGPVHSYAFRLSTDLAPLWEHAWVNRIALFLRRWAAHQADTPEETLFGPLPAPEIRLTHDVDALEKTFPTRAKALAFDLFNAVRLISKGDLKQAFGRIKKGLGFFFRRANYNYLDHIKTLEQSFGQTSTFNVYGGKTPALRSPKSFLMDPGYDITKPKFSTPFRALAAQGFVIGVHPSFDVFDDPVRLRAQMDRIEQASGKPVTEIRQHWLRFTWAGTWRAQEAAGLSLDTTLGFNDRPGFRNGAALSMPAWIASEQRASETLTSQPLLLMDSHLFDYHLSDEDTRRATIDRWLDEVKAVKGIATIVWHQRVFHPKDYGWGEDYEYLLSRLPRV